MAESVQHILKRRALDGQYPKDVATIIDWLEATARGWNTCPTPFIWGGKRSQRRRQHGNAVCIGWVAQAFVPSTRWQGTYIMALLMPLDLLG